MTAQEKRTKSGEIILNLIQGKTAATVAEVEKKAKLPHQEIVEFFKDLEAQGQGRFIVGRRGSPSRFVRFQDMRHEEPKTPLDVKVDVHENGKVELRFTTTAENLGSLVQRLKKSEIKAFALDISQENPAVVVMIAPGDVGDVLLKLKAGVTN